MKIIVSLAGMLMLLFAGAQAQSLPEMKMPDIPYKPSITKGWVGQYVYELKFNDSTGVGKGINRKYCHVIINRINSGYIEFPTEVRGAIRVNQPDKYNKERYESWVRSGSSNCWNKHDETDTFIEPSARKGFDGITGRVEKYSRYTSGTDWVKGWLSYTDLQIDHTTGKYSFAIPVVGYELEGEETIIRINYNPAKKEIESRKENKRHGLGLAYLQYGNGDWDMLEGTFTKGQKEIIFRERIPVTLHQFITEGVTTLKSPAKKGFIDFYLVLRRVPFTGNETGKKSASSEITPAPTTEPGQVKTKETSTAEQTKTPGDADKSREDKTQATKPSNKTQKTGSTIDSTIKKQKIGSGIRNKVNGKIGKIF